MMEAFEASEKEDDDDGGYEKEKKTIEKPVMSVMSVDKQDSVETSSPSVQTSKRMHKNTYISYAAAISGGGVHEWRRKH